MTIMSLLLIVLVISLYLFKGLIIYRFLAIGLLKSDSYLSETEIIAPWPVIPANCTCCQDSSRVIRS